MQLNEKISVIEAILFASGEPVEFDRLAQAADVELSTLHKLVSMLNSNLSERDSAIEILRKSSLRPSFVPQWKQERAQLFLLRQWKR